MTNAEVVSTPADSRPEPGPYPDVYLCQCKTWDGKQWFFSVYHSGTIECARAEAESQILKGRRNVRIVRIPGDAAKGGA